MALMPAFHPKSAYEGLSLHPSTPRFGVGRTSQDTVARNSLPPVWVNVWLDPCPGGVALSSVQPCLSQSPVQLVIYILVTCSIMPSSSASFPTPESTYTQSLSQGLLLWDPKLNWGFPGGTSGKEPACQRRTHKTGRFDTWIRKIPWRRAWQPTLIFMLWA